MAYHAGSRHARYERLLRKHRSDTRTNGVHEISHERYAERSTMDGSTGNIAQGSADEKNQARPTNLHGQWAAMLGKRQQIETPTYGETTTQSTVTDTLSTTTTTTTTETEATTTTTSDYSTITPTTSTTFTDNERPSETTSSVETPTETVTDTTAPTPTPEETASETETATPTPTTAAETTTAETTTPEPTQTLTAEVTTMSNSTPTPTETTTTTPSTLTSTETTPSPGAPAEDPSDFEGTSIDFPTAVIPLPPPSMTGGSSIIDGILGIPAGESSTSDYTSISTTTNSSTTTTTETTTTLLTPTPTTDLIYSTTSSDSSSFTDSPNSDSGGNGSGYGEGYDETGTGSVPAPTDSTTDSSSSSSSLDSETTGKIVGGVVGGVAGAAILLILAFLLLRRRRKGGFMLGAQRLGDGDGGGGMAREGSTRNMVSRDSNRDFAAAYFAPAFMKRWRQSQRSTGEESIISSEPSERGFQKISGRKLPSGLQPALEYSSGIGVGGLEAGSPTGSEPSPTMPVLPRSPISQPPPSIPYGMPLDTSYTRESEEDGVVMFRPSPARTPVTGSAGTAWNESSAAPRAMPMPIPIPGIPKRPDAVGRSHPSYDGSRGSRFTESI